MSQNNPTTLNTITTLKNRYVYLNPLTNNSATEPQPNNENK